jgi:hypothetical protein
MENKAIEIVQLPIIREHLAVIGAEITAKIESLNIDNIVANEDSVKMLKEMRAELNKDLEVFEQQRKAVKEGILNPYNSFESVYKVEISDKMKRAVDTLKDKISFVEDAIKAEKRDAIKQYFAELCASESIDFVTFESVGLEINLSTTEKKYREQCVAFIEKIKDELNLIDTQDFKAEILVEYKRTLNAARAIADVRNRKEAEAKEAERLKAIEEAKANMPTPVAPEVLQAPKVVENVTADFRVICTAEQLKALGLYMRQNGIIYQNI